MRCSFLLFSLSFKLWWIYRSPWANCTFDPFWLPEGVFGDQYQLAHVAWINFVTWTSFLPGTNGAIDEYKIIFKHSIIYLEQNKLKEEKPQMRK